MLNVRLPPPLQHFLFSLAPGFVDILNFYCQNILSLLFVSAMAVFSPRHFLFLPGKKKSPLITQQPWLISQLVVFNIPDSLVLWHFSLHAAGVQWRSGGDVCFGDTHTQTHSLTRLLWGLKLYSYCGWFCLPECSVKVEVTFISACLKDVLLGVFSFSFFLFFSGMLYINDFHLIGFKSEPQLLIHGSSTFVVLMYSLKDLGW